MKSELQCYRKHLLRDKIYDIYIDDQKMTLQHLNEPPKYIIQLNWSVEISWNLYGDEFSFGLKANNKYKWFYGKPPVILQLKSLLSKFVAFKNFQQFYSPGPHIANGTTSSVYQLTRKSDDNTNFIVKSTLKAKGDINKLYQQLNIIRQLDHPNLPKFVEFYSGEESFYTILEQIRGLSLSQIIKESKSALNIPLIQKIMTDLLYVLLNLQNHKIIHRGIRPENIIFDHKSQQKKTKLVHFQFACFQGTNQKIQGTPGYIAPEVLNGNHFGPESDVFSLGCVFYKLLVKKDLFQGQNKNEILSENKKCQINLQHLSLIRVPQTAQNLLAEMLRIEPKLRIKVSEAINHSFFKTTTQFSARNLSIGSNKADRNSVFNYSQFQPIKQEVDIQLDDYFTNELPPATQIPIMNKCKGGRRREIDEVDSQNSKMSRMRVSKSTG